jgi:hypothetical protein
LDRAWRAFEADGQRLLDKLCAGGLTKRFDYGGAFGCTEMLKDQIAGRNSSWAIRWHATCFLASRFTLYPGDSLVHNIGFDSSGHHCSTTTQFDQRVSQHPVHLQRIALEESQVAWQAFADFLRGVRDPLSVRVRARLRRAVSQALRAFVSRSAT